MDRASFGKRDALAVAGFTIVTALLCLPVYSSLNATFDEAFHAAAGLGLIRDGDYRVEIQHPPIARAPGGLLLALSGLEARPAERVFGGIDEYWKNLTLARLGTLAFAPLLLGFTWKWAKELGGPRQLFARRVLAERAGSGVALDPRLCVRRDRLASDVLVLEVAREPDLD